MRLPIALLLAVLAAGCDREKPPAPQEPAPAARAQAPAAVLDRTRKGETPPTVLFRDPDGAAVSLAAFEGRPLLLNLWATWCAPCVAEMPALDRLAARMPGLQVVTVSQDLEPAKVAAFFEKGRFAKIEPYLDPDLELMTLLQASNLPTTILFDAAGREVWRMTGAAEWDGAETAELIAEANPAPAAETNVSPATVR